MGRHLQGHLVQCALISQPSAQPLHWWTPLHAFMHVTREPHQATFHISGAQATPPIFKGLGYILSKWSRGHPAPFLGLSSGSPTFMRSFPFRLPAPSGVGAGWCWSSCRVEAEALGHEQLCSWEKVELGLGGVLTLRTLPQPSPSRGSMWKAGFAQGGSK